MKIFSSSTPVFKIQPYKLKNIFIDIKSNEIVLNILNFKILKVGHDKVFFEKVHGFLIQIPKNNISNIQN
ncbi:hypothetical protein [Mesomycoplasma neurolyticum]|uniref:Uncharacterized protein n=1 Tax=Mesomycoplasma neurolyticum TaxID=2120 RepID=A0A449A503_9BACT|nr:hypothetical protein [Mesomycoplasma neurolyticum]VEU59318.1 Uncharacterised protein [Mesomycoplasma neurolyticum]